MFLGKEVNFAKSLLDIVNGTSLEVNNIWQSLYLGRHARQEAREISVIRSRLA